MSSICYDTSDKACLKFGFHSGQQVFTPEGPAKVVGVYENKLWLHIDGNSEPSSWKVDDLQEVVSELPTFADSIFKPYKVKNSNTVINFDIGRTACAPFKLYAGDRVSCSWSSVDQATVVGVYLNSLWIHKDKDDGASRTYGTFYQLFQSNERLQRDYIETTTTGQVWFSTTVCNFSWPIERGMIVDDKDNIYHIFRTSGTIACGWFKRDPRKDFEEEMVVQLGDKYVCPEHMAVYENHIYATATMSTIFKYNMDTHKISVFVSRNEDAEIQYTLGGMEGIAIDKNGILYVPQHKSIIAIDLKKNIVSTFASHIPQFNPRSLTVADDGTIYYNELHCIGMLKNGKAKIIAGKRSKSDHVDGPCKSALFRNPSELHWHDNTLYVSDINCIRIIDLRTQTVSTFMKIRGDRSFAVDKRGNLYVHVHNTIKERFFVKLEQSWQYERFLWIGKLKEDPKYCHLARLPRELIVQIAAAMKWPALRQKVSPPQPVKAPKPRKKSKK